MIKIQNKPLYGNAVVFDGTNQKEVKELLDKYLIPYADGSCQISEVVKNEDDEPIQEFKTINTYRFSTGEGTIHTLKKDEIIVVLDINSIPQIYNKKNFENKYIEL